MSEPRETGMTESQREDVAMAIWLIQQYAEPNELIGAIAQALHERRSLSPPEGLPQETTRDSNSSTVLTAGDSDNPMRALNTHGQTGSEANSADTLGPANMGAVAKNVGAIRQEAERPAVNTVDEEETTTVPIALIREVVTAMNGPAFSRHGGAALRVMLTAEKLALYLSQARLASPVPPSAAADPPREPNRFRCNDDCGIVSVTEDGCCRTCGADTTPVYVPPLRELVEEIRADPLSIHNPQLPASAGADPPPSIVADALADLGLVEGATLSSVQRRLHVGTADAMRLFALYEAIKSVRADPPPAPGSDELEPVLVLGAQFPSQACADKRLAAIDAYRRQSPPPGEPT